MIRSAPTRSFRDVPPAVYIALALSAAGALASAIAVLLATGSLGERYLAVQRWTVLHNGADLASTVLLALGLLELARRHVGRARALTRAGAWLGLAGCAWFALRIAEGLADASHDQMELAYKWTGGGLVLLGLAGTMLLTLGAGAWRRAPVAATALVLTDVVSFGTPWVGAAMAELVTNDPVARQVFALARGAVYGVAMLMIAATLAADGRAPAPEPDTAARQLRLARAALLFRVVAAALISTIVVGGRSPGTAKLVTFAGPATVVVTMLVFAIALQRVASARIEGMRPALLSLGAALTLWWGMVQLDQLTLLLQALHSDYLAEHAVDMARSFSIAGPLVATLGLMLVGCAITAFARHRADLALGSAATARTTMLVVATLASLGLQLQLPKATTLGSALGLMTFAALLAIVAFAALIGLLARAADALEADPGLPPARLV